jgi:GT2 family glycosyltransferase
LSGTADVGAVLVNWNGGELTARCLASLMAGGVVPDRVIVVDNGSQDGSPDLLAARFPFVEMVRNERNLGFAAGTNIGIRRALDAGCELVWVLNNDTRVAPTCLEALMASLARDGSVAAVSGKILLEDPPTVLWYAGATWRRWRLAAPHRGQGQRDAGQFDEEVDVGFLSGCCMLVRAQALESVGLFDERFFAYYEDADWCLRALEHGLCLRYVPAAVLWHTFSASIRTNTLRRGEGRTSALNYYLVMRNRLLILRKHGRGVARWAATLGALGLEVMWLSAALVLLRRWRKLAAVWRGLADGLRSEPRGIVAGAGAGRVVMP